MESSTAKQRGDDASSAPGATDTRPVSVVVPTIGRPDLLRACLTSVAACVPSPAEVVVVDQSDDGAVREVVESTTGIPARWVPCGGRGIARGTNLGIRAAVSDAVMVTHDDCTVRPDWVGVGHALLQSAPEALFSGRVLPAGDNPDAVPSTRTAPAPEAWDGVPVYGVLYPANMAFSRLALLAFGGFDERPTLALAAEDNDLCYRWLRAGGKVCYEPDLVVWHHDWRTPDQLEAMYRTYAKGQGAFYAKHLHDGDLRVLRFLWWDATSALRSVVAARRHGRPRWSDPRRALAAGIPAGMLSGWRDAVRRSPKVPRSGWD